MLSDSRYARSCWKMPAAAMKTCCESMKRWTVLAQAEPRLAHVVEMRYFGGYTEAEIAETLDLTERTVRRDWDKARLILSSMLKD